MARNRESKTFRIHVSVRVRPVLSSHEAERVQYSDDEAKHMAVGVLRPRSAASAEDAHVKGPSSFLVKRHEWNRGRISVGGSSAGVKTFTCFSNVMVPSETQASAQDRCMPGFVDSLMQGCVHCVCQHGCPHRSRVSFVSHRHRNRAAQCMPYNCRYNCTLFAYGQTGSGKTYTMFGPEGGVTTTSTHGLPAGSIPQAWGMFPRTAAQVLYRLGLWTDAPGVPMPMASPPGGGGGAGYDDGASGTTSLAVSAVEVYFDEVFDLLNERKNVRVGGTALVHVGWHTHTYTYARTHTRTMVAPWWHHSLSCVVMWVLGVGRGAGGACMQCGGVPFDHLCWVAHNHCLMCVGSRGRGTQPRCRRRSHTQPPQVAAGQHP